ncbi:MAG: phosphoglycerate mutase, partial [Burkholderiaceae bacterium]|nr:phosphoglycerate mutase [Burkholderiaceae bacterium]
MSDILHLLIPYAACSSPGSQQALQGLQLAHLDRLIARLVPLEGDVGDDETLSAPHERALARALGLPGGAGRIPWAAWHLHQQGRAQEAAHSAWAFVTPCHWQVRTDHVTLDDPAELGLSEEASRALLAIMAPWFAGDGITLHYDQPTRWLAQGELLADLPTASPERVLRRDVSHWLPGSHKTHPLQRLHSEMQMLLYT